ncbi:MAG: FG-GAP-like repeat-containing protein [Candidatus Aquicultorales bacterium]
MGALGKTKTLKGLALLLALLLLISLMGIGSMLAAGTGSISGKVTNSQGLDLGGITVSATPVSFPGDPVSTMTQPDGTYYIGGLDAGTYAVDFIPVGYNYVEEWYNDKSDYGSATPITVGTGNTPNINAILQSGAIITGQVTDDQQTPLPLQGVSVKAEPVDGSGNPDISRVSIPGTTDSSGNYTIMGLAPGFYKVSFNKQSSGYALQYYNDKLGFSGANVLTATSGGTLSNINARLHRGGAISGTVRDDALNPKGYAFVKAMPIDAFGNRDTQRPELSTRTAPNGTYAISGLGAGGYKVFFLVEGENFAVQYYNDRPDFASASILTIDPDSLISNVDAQMHPGGIFSGKVSDSTDPVPGVVVSAKPVDAGGNPDPNREELSAQTYFNGVDAVYEIMGLTPGTYKVEFDGTSLNYERQYYNLKSDLASANIVTATSGGTVPNINAVIRTGSRIMGRVTDDVAPTPNGLANVTVSAIPVDAGGNEDPTRVGGSAVSDATGNYAIAGLFAGDYKVFFSAGGQNFSPQYYNDKVAFALAEIVTLGTAADRTGVDARMHAGSTIAGLVTDGSSNPLGGISVTVLPVDETGEIDPGRQIVKIYSMPDGYYQALGLVLGEYKILFEDEDRFYAPEYYDSVVAFTDATAVEVTSLGQSITGKDAQLAVGGAIEGTVRTEGGSPVSGVYLSATTTDTPGGYALTDSNGVYRISGLADASYKVSSYNEKGYVDRFFSGASTVETATAVGITGGSTQSSIDFSLPSVAADSYEADNDQASAKPIAKDGSAQDRTSTPADVDYASFSGLAGMRYVVTLANAEGQSQITLINGTLKKNSFKLDLVNSSGTVVESREGFTGSGSIDWTATASGTYYARVTFNGQGAGRYDLSVTEIDIPPASPTGLSVGDRPGDHGGAIDLSWTAPNAADLNHYDIYRSSAPEGPFAPAGQTSQVSFTDTGLTNGLTYYYYVVAVDDGGLNSPATGTGSASPADNLPPGAPWGLTVTDHPSDHGGSLDLAWNAPTDDPNLAGYNIYRGTSPGSYPTKVNGPLVTGTTYTDTGLVNGTTYYYIVKAVDSLGNGSPNSNESSRPPADNLAPDAPTGLNAVLQSGSVVLSWTAPTNDPNLAGYKIERTLSGTGNWIQIGTSTTNGFSHPVTLPDQGNTWSYRVRAHDAANNDSGYSNTASILVPDSTAPTVPSDLAVARSGSNLDLTWTASTDNVAVAGYRIERSTSQTTGFEEIGTGATATYSDSTAAADVRYYYRVRAYDTDGNNSGYSNTADGIVDTLAPSVPGTPTATLVGFTVNLSWAASTDNVGVTAYIVEKSENQTDWTELGTSQTTTFGYELPAQDKTKFLYYRIKARDAAGNTSAASASVKVKAKKHTVNDSTGDGKSDIIGFYNYGNKTSGAWVFNAMGSANPAGVTFNPISWWKSAPGYFDSSKVKMVTGDFDGDAMTDVMALYNYGGTTSALWLWKSTGTGYSEPTQVFHSAGWVWNSTKLVSGDFNGDGKEELFAFYTYGGTHTGVYVFEQNAQGNFTYRQVFDSPYWDWTKTRLLSAKGEDKAKVVAAYNYGGTQTGLWVFELDGAGKLKYPVLSFFSAYWDFSKTSFLTGDVEGDGLTDVMALYNYGGTHTGVFEFKATGQPGDKAYAYPAFIYESTQWDYAKSTFIPGDFNADGKSDAGAIYNYGGGTMGIWVFVSNGTKLADPVRVYLSTAWNSWATTWLMPY